MNSGQLTANGHQSNTPGPGDLVQVEGWRGAVRSPAPDPRKAPPGAAAAPQVPRAA